MLMQVLMLLSGFSSRHFDSLLMRIQPAMGLQYGWRSFAWVAGIPPFIIVILFKVYIDRVFARPFRYYVPSEAEVRNAHVHSEHGDVRGNRLGKRFGHPALHAELFTPMLHANMMPLLGQVYSGRLDSQQAKMGEYGGQQLNARVLPGGIKIAGVDQSDLEYDPVLYQRDRGELDWDQRSIATALDSVNFSGRNSPAPSLPGYGRYLSQGPARDSEIELVRLDADQQPLLLPTNLMAGQGAGQSSQSLPGYSSPHLPYAVPAGAQYPPPPGIAYQGRVPSNDGLREAPTHRPYHGRASSGYSFNSSGRDSPGANMAGRGTFR